MIKKHLYTSDEKLQWWGPGEWIEEQDIAEFKHLGFKCEVLRVKSGLIFGGHFAGYVYIPENHQYYRKHYDKINIKCHGGLTYSSADENNNFCIGFDCAHSTDIMPCQHNLDALFPLSDELKNAINGYIKRNPPSYKNMDYCIQQCIDICIQLFNLDKI